MIILTLLLSVYRFKKKTFDLLKPPCCQSIDGEHKKINKLMFEQNTQT